MEISTLGNATLSCVKHFTDRRETLNQAGAILVLLANAFSSDADASELANAAHNYGAAPEWANLNPLLFRDALEGVASLIAAACHLEDEEVRS